MDDFEAYFKEHFRFTCYGPGLWRVYNKQTDQSASPVYNSKEAAINYVKREMELQMEEAIDGLLGVPTIPNVED